MRFSSLEDDDGNEMTREQYEDMNMFARKDWAETEEGARLIQKWNEEDCK